MGNKVKYSICINPVTRRIKDNPPKCVIKKVWLVPSPDIPSSHDCPYVSKEMFGNIIGLKLMGDVSVSLDDVMVLSSMKM